MRLITLHDILTAWQDGKISYRDALARTGIEQLDELYEAAHNSGVAIRTTFTAEEIAAGQAMAELLMPTPHLVKPITMPKSAALRFVESRHARNTDQ